MKTVKVSSKGQVTLPADTLRAVRAKMGTEFLLIQEGHRIVLMPAEQVARDVLNELGGWEALGLSAFEGVWDNEADEIWNEA